MNREVDIREVLWHTKRYVREATNGQELIVTKDGKPVANFEKLPKNDVPDTKIPRKKS
jgi:antitoxin (DNA-binding transcriptional repressor) of toxin-antitoxin stability system